MDWDGTENIQNDAKGLQKKQAEGFIDRGSLWEGFELVLCHNRIVGARGHVEVGRGSEDIDPYQVDGPCGE